MNPERLLIHGLLDASRVNGPGLRAVVFVQGCVLGCDSCWNPRSHAVNGAGTWMSVQEVQHWIADCRAAEGIDGVTFSGGEPMHQAAALVELVEVASQQHPSIGFGMFSGYTETELEQGRYKTRDPLPTELRASVWSQLKASLDFAVLGRFVASRPSQLSLRSSDNQALRIYRSKHWESDFIDPETEITIEANGLLTITGFPTAGIPA